MRVEHEYERKSALALLVGLDIPHRPIPALSQDHRDRPVHDASRPDDHAPRL